MNIFLETLSAILVAGKMMGLIDISMPRALIPVIISVVTQAILAAISTWNKRTPQVINFNSFDEFEEAINRLNGKKDDDEGED